MKPAKMRRAGAGVLLGEMRRHMLRAHRALAVVDQVYRELKRRDDARELEFEEYLRAEGEQEATTKAPDQETSFLLGHRARRGRAR